MKKTFKVGDKVRIRQWEDMKKEFGLDKEGHINAIGLIFWNNGMRTTCGGAGTILSITKKGNYVTIEGFRYYYSTYILEHIEEKQEPRQPKRGDRVLMSINGNYWEERIYIITVIGAYQPYISVSSYCEVEYHNGDEYEIYQWGYMKPLEPKKELTKREIFKSKGRTKAAFEEMISK